MCSRDDSKVELALVQERQKGAGAGVRLDHGLKRRGAANDTGQTAGYSIEDRSGRIRADRHRLGRLLGAPRACRQLERDEHYDNDEPRRIPLAIHGKSPLRPINLIPGAALCQRYR